MQLKEETRFVQLSIEGESKDRGCFIPYEKNSGSKKTLISNKVDS